MSDAIQCNATCWKDLDAIRELMPRKVQRVLLYGWPATGKSKFGHMLAERLGVESYPVTLNEDMGAADLIGMQMPDGKAGVTFLEGPATRAFRGGVLNLDEIDKAGPDAQVKLHSILDDADTARLYLPTGETVTPAKNFCVVATMNATPDALPEPIRSRFQITVNVSSPAPGILSTLQEREEPCGNVYRFAAALVGAYAGAEGDEGKPPWFDSRQMLTFSDLILDGVAADIAARWVWESRGEEILDHLKLGARDGDEAVAAASGRIDV